MEVLCASLLRFSSLPLLTLAVCTGSDIMSFLELNSPCLYCDEKIGAVCWLNRLFTMVEFESSMRLLEMDFRGIFITKSGKFQPEPSYVSLHYTRLPYPISIIYS
jgi:hypothetical protein